MKRYTITIPDNKAQLFIDLLNELSFIEEIEEIPPIDIPEEHKQVVRDRIEKYSNSKKDYIEWEQMDNEIQFD